MRVLLVVLLAGAGLVLGPVLRAFAVRLAVPPGRPWRRSCPVCGTSLSLAGSVLPVTSATGRCSTCRTRVGPPSFTVEVTAAVLLGLLAARVHPGLTLAAMCWLAVCAVPLGYIDAVVKRLPNLLTGSALAGTAGLLLIASAAGGHWSILGRGLLGGVAFAAFCLVLLLVSPSGMGLGDVKLAASLGAALAWLSWTALIAGIFAGFLLAAVYGAALLMRGRANRKTQIPFGPFMIVGTFLVLLIAG
ncbi:MAG TPA: prepilin peptidase [Streptosporangiaceae bacterium]|jgi:leader peptidase (prepilin peptidase)/N-methyltransferase|nr:prepilin peptidase [Streptosporangiaceae bacterium]